MKKVLFIASFLMASFFVNAQAQKYLNFGGVGTGLYASLEFPVASMVTIAPAVYTDWNFNKFVFAAKGNFYFDELFELTSDWDVYGGANVGWRLDSSDKNDDGFNWGAHVGGRWFWSAHAIHEAITVLAQAHRSQG